MKKNSILLTILLTTSAISLQGSPLKASETAIESIKKQHQTYLPINKILTKRFAAGIVGISECTSGVMMLGLSTKLAEEIMPEVIIKPYTNKFDNYTSTRQIINFQSTLEGCSLKPMPSNLSTWQIIKYIAKNGKGMVGCAALGFGLMYNGCKNIKKAIKNKPYPSK